MIVLAKSGLVDAVRQVRQFLADHNVETEVHFGWKHPPRNDVAPRIVIVPSDPDSGDSGPVTLNVNPGKIELKDLSGKTIGHVRILREWERTFTVSVWASTSKSEEELVEETETLFEWVVRAFQHAAGGQVSWGRPKWTVAVKENNNGRALLVPGVMNTPLFDVPTETAHPTTSLTGEFAQPEPAA